MFRIKNIKGFESVKGKYYITTCGKVLTDSKNSRNFFLSPNINGKGYHQVVLYNDDGTKKRPYIHKLVALAFIKNKNNEEQVDHIDNCKEHNFIGNLSWISNKDNSLKKVSIDKKSNAKLSDCEVVVLRKEFNKQRKTFKDFWNDNKEKYRNISEKAMRYAIQKKSYFWVD